MKKYHHLSELVIDIRKSKGISQLELSHLLDVDTRTVVRWEKGDTILNPEMKQRFVEKLHVPHQVIHNLNAAVPIAIYYSMELQTYSLNALGSEIPPASWFKNDLPLDDESVVYLDETNEVQLSKFVLDVGIQDKELSVDLLKQSLKVVPELIFSLYDGADFCSGYLMVLKLNYGSYLKLKNKEIAVSELNSFHLAKKMEEEPHVFFIYLNRADSVPTAYFLLNKIYSYFKSRRLSNYILAAVESSEFKVGLLHEMGLSSVWETNSNPNHEILLEGNLDMFLFGKMQ